MNYATHGEAASIGIIGGADGPTAIFVSGILSELPLLTVLTGVLIAGGVLLALVLLFLRGRK